MHETRHFAQEEFLISSDFEKNRQVGKKTEGDGLWRKTPIILSTFVVAAKHLKFLFKIALCCVFL